LKYKLKFFSLKKEIWVLSIVPIGAITGLLVEVLLKMIFE